MRAGNGRTLLALAALLVALPAAADYKDSYSRGLEAAKDGNWAEVRKYMSEAYAEHGEPAPRIRLYGQRWESYVPQYYLGLAAYKTGDCKTALERWKDPAEGSVLQGLSDLKKALDRDRGACEATLASIKPTPTCKDLDDDRDGVNNCDDKCAGTPAGTKVGSDGCPLKTCKDLDDDRDGVNNCDDKCPNTPAGTNVASDGCPRKLVETKVEPPKDPTKIEPKGETLPVASRVPQPLLDAARAWLAGRYAEVVRINPDAYADARAKAQALVLRAAARYTQATIDSDRELLDQARADVRTLKTLDPRFQPDATLFSPRFRAFFTETK